MILFGSLLFFWFAELTERTHHLILSNESQRKDPLYTSHMFAQNVLRRMAHPAPLSRFDLALIYLADLDLGESSFVQNMKELWLFLSETMEFMWNKIELSHGEDMFYRVQEHRKLSRKWMEDIPFISALNIDESKRYHFTA
jgi:hypothetical protein